MLSVLFIIYEEQRLRPDICYSGGIGVANLSPPQWLRLVRAGRDNETL